MTNHDSECSLPASIAKNWRIVFQNPKTTGIMILGNFTPLRKTRESRYVLLERTGKNKWREVASAREGEPYREYFEKIISEV